MMRKYLIIIVLIPILNTLSAQNIYITEFEKVLKSEQINDKNFALVELLTDEGGFKFSIRDKELLVKEEDKKITILLPHKSIYVKIEHPVYGWIMWKIPGKGVRKRKTYRGILLTPDPKKEYKITKQWVVLDVNPKSAIITIDSNTTKILDGKFQQYLSIGKHPIKVEAPFYSTLSDTLDIQDTTKLQMQINLEPEYSYLSVKSNLLDSQIFLDGEYLGDNEAVSKKIMPGSYRLIIKTNGPLGYDELVEVNKGERKVINAQLYDIVEKYSTTNDNLVGDDALHTITTENSSSEMANVTINAFDDDSYIWINRENKGRGSWNGLLSKGFYVIHTTKNELISPSHYLFIEDNKSIELNLLTPMINYGVLNISSNIIGAKIYLNQQEVGTTPLIIENLPVSRHYTIRVEQSGYKSKEVGVYLNSNDMRSINVKLKK